MELLHHGVDQSVIALWLGHESVESTQVYIHADLRLKEKALARIAAPSSQPGRYRPDDHCSASSKPSDYAEDSARLVSAKLRTDGPAEHQLRVPAVLH